MATITTSRDAGDLDGSKNVNVSSETYKTSQCLLYTLKIIPPYAWQFLMLIIGNRYDNSLLTAECVVSLQAFDLLIKVQMCEN